MFAKHSTPGVPYDRHDLRVYCTVLYCTVMYCVYGTVYCVCGTCA